MNIVQPFSLHLARNLSLFCSLVCLAFVPGNLRASHPSAGVYMGTFGGTSGSGSFAFFVGSDGWGAQTSYGATGDAGSAVEGFTVNTNGSFAYSVGTTQVAGTIIGSSITGTYTGTNGSGNFSGTLKSATGTHQTSVGFYSGAATSGATNTGTLKLILAADGSFIGTEQDSSGDEFVDDGYHGTFNALSQAEFGSVEGTGVWVTLNTNATIIGNWSNEHGTGPLSLTRTHGLAIPAAQAAVCDFNGDGVDDVLWQDNATTSYGAWLLPSKTWQWVSGGNNGAWKIPGMADVNGDGVLDVVWQNTSTGELGAWQMPSKSWIGLAPAGGGTWRVVLTGDVNGDGKADLIWQNTATTDYGAWLMPARTFQWLSPGNNGTWKIVAVADVNGDSTADVIWQNTSTTDVGSWLMPAKTWQWVAPGNNGAWKVVGASDVNQDGKADLLWQNSSTTEAGAWLLPAKTWQWVSPGNNGTWRINGRSP